MTELTRKSIIWVGNSKKDLREFPAAVRRDLGTALFWAELGRVHPAAKPMKGQLRDVTEIIADHRGNTFRAMYTTRIGNDVYVLHAFQKKSTKGNATPQCHLDLIKARLALARHFHANRREGNEQQ